MSKDDLPLYELFTRLRGAGFLLGTSDYKLLLELLLADCDTSNRTLLTVLTTPSSIKNLCQTLWVKTASQRLVFEEIFAEVFNKTLYAEYSIAVEEQAPPSKSQHGTEATQKVPAQDSDKEPEQENDDVVDKDKGEYFFFPPAPSPYSETPIENSQVIKAIQINPYEWVSFKPSGLPKEYFPVTAQQMQQGWYALRRPIRQGKRLELDIAATIEQTKRLGKFFYPVQRPRMNKSGQLVLLIDHRGSMQPFHVLSRLLVETALKAGCLEQTSCYYFNNYPRSTLYGDSQFETEYNVEEVIQRFNPNRTVALIFSDAGAARGNFMQGRIYKTFDFLELLQQHCKALTWLNPIPEDDWKETTAEAIVDAKIVNMFSANFSGFQKAIRVLQ